MTDMAHARPLDDEAIARLRAELATGKRPSLVLLSGGAGLPAGSRGQLIRIDDPPQDAEFLHVKVGHDELPFAPEEVGLPGRRGRSSEKAVGPTPVAAAPGPVSASAAARAPAPASATASQRSTEPILEPVRPDRRTRAERVVQPPPPPAEPAVAGVDDEVAERPVGSTEPGGAVGTSGATRPRRSPRSGVGGPPKITLTLRFADFGWTVEGLVGGRRDKVQPVPLAAIRAFADQLEDQSLRRQIESTVEACRSEAEKRAAALRAELARLETELAALDD
jgi:hypothetical protein